MQIPAAASCSGGGSGSVMSVLRVLDVLCALPSTDCMSYDLSRVGLRQSSLHGRGLPFHRRVRFVSMGLFDKKTPSMWNFCEDFEALWEVPCLGFKMCLHPKAKKHTASASRMRKHWWVYVSEYGPKTCGCLFGLSRCSQRDLARDE